MVLLETSFWDVVWWMIMVYFLFMIIWMFISVFADIFRRDDMSGLGKAVWIIALFLIPWISIIIYFCFRPRETASDRQMMRQARGTSDMDEIAKAQQLLTSGAINQAEFDAIKARALG